MGLLSIFNFSSTIPAATLAPAPHVRLSNCICHETIVSYRVNYMLPHSIIPSNGKTDLLILLLIWQVMQALLARAQVACWCLR